jgi:hypothetical protein
MACILKGEFKKYSHNPNTRAAQNYSMVECLSQCLSTLEVLQSFSLQRKDFLSTLGSVEICNPRTIILYMIDLKPHLPHHVVFHIVVAYTTKSITQNIFCTLVDDSASTCVMLLVCWKAIGQPVLSL